MVRVFGGSTATTLASILISLAMVPATATTITNPVGLGGIINSDAYVLVQEAGDTSLSAFNGYVTNPAIETYRFSFETGDGYTEAATVTRVTLTQVDSGIALVTDLGISGSGFSRLQNNFRPTSGSGALAYQGTITQATFSLSAPVDAVGFTLNRFSSTAVIELYSDAALTAPIGDPVSMTGNQGVGTERSFFGETSASRDIRGVRITNNGNQQFGIDDFTVAVVPEPTGLWLAALGIGLAAARRTRRGSHDLQ
jgi:MYXO-CTERM domain-containing protein